MKGLFFALIVLIFAACSPNNVQEDASLGKYFTENKVEGCFALMDNGTGKFTVYNLSRYRDSAYLPASTFKIVNSLIGLQTGVITNDSMLIEWDSITRPVADWNKDLRMYEAFNVSAVPYYQEVARRIGKDTMEFWLDSMRYGAKTDTQQVKITTRVDSFWLDNSLTVTPDQQLGLIKRLYFDQLPFFVSNQETVKRVMMVEDNTNYRLAYKTGWGENNGRQIGWVVGWIEENRHPYFFVLNVESADAGVDIKALRLKMLDGILEQLGFKKGKM